MLSKHQANKLAMEKRTLKLLNSNLAKYPNVPALKDAAADLASTISQIEAKSAEKGDATIGKTDAKNLAESELINAILPVAGACHSLASREKDLVMMKKTALNRTMLERMRDEDLESEAKSIFDIASSRAEEVASRGATAERLTNLTAKTAAYKESRGEQKMGVPRRKGAAKTLDDLFKESDRLLHDEIDHLMENLADTEPQFYTEYHAARRIDDLGVRHRPENDNSPAPPAK